MNSVVVHIGRALRGTPPRSDLPMELRSALSVIVLAGPVRMGALARMEHLSAPAVTRAVDILASHGLVRRQRDPRDARASLIVATKKGRDLVTRGRDERARHIDMALERLSPSARRRIASVIRDLETLSQELRDQP